jgi:hypothetical protein
MENAIGGRVKRERGQENEGGERDGKRGKERRKFVMENGNFGDLIYVVR